MTLLQIQEDLINFCQDFHVTTTKLIDVKKFQKFLTWPHLFKKWISKRYPPDKSLSIRIAEVV